MQQAITREVLRDCRDSMFAALASGFPRIAEYEHRFAVEEQARAYDALQKKLGRMGFMRVQIAPPEESTWACV